MEISGLAYMIHNQLEMMENARKEMMKCIHDINRQPTKQDLEAFQECRCGTTEALKTCPYCSVESKILKYEKMLYQEVHTNNKNVFKSVDSNKRETEVLSSTSRIDGELERVLKCMSSLHDHIPDDPGENFPRNFELMFF